MSASAFEPHRSRLSAAADLPIRRFAIHGLALELHCGMSPILSELDHWFAPFEVASWPEGFLPVIGMIEPFDSATVQRHVSPTAKRFAGSTDTVELYQDAERFWLVDDRWGMAELNLLKNRWRSWLLPQPTTDTAQLVETAIVWPLAQLLRAKGLHLLPAVSVAREGWGALILSPFGIEPELSALARNGYQIIGQRWTAVREEDGRIAMLHIPGWVERQTAPRLRYLGIESPTGRLDLTTEITGAFQNHAFCNVALIAEPGRRPRAHLRELSHVAAVNVLRRSWPLVDLHPNRRLGQLAPRLAQHCRCAEPAVVARSIGFVATAGRLPPRPARHHNHPPTNLAGIGIDPPDRVVNPALAGHLITCKAATSGRDVFALRDGATTGRGFTVMGAND